MKCNLFCFQASVVGPQWERSCGQGFTTNIDGRLTLSPVNKLSNDATKLRPPQKVMVIDVDAGPLDATAARLAGPVPFRQGGDAD